MNPGSRWFSWLMLSNQDDLLLDYAGFDALMFLKTQQFATRFFAILSVLSLVILIPINLSAGYKDENVGLHTLSIASLPNNSAKLWAPAVATLLFALVGYRMLIKLWREFVVLRRDFVNHELADRRIRARSIMLLETPAHLTKESTLSKAAKRALDECEVRNAKVEKIFIDRDVIGLSELLAERNAKLAKLEVLLVQFVSEYERNEAQLYNNGEIHEPSTSMYKRFRHWRAERKYNKRAEAVQNIVGNTMEVLGQSISIDTLTTMVTKLGKQNTGHTLWDADLVQKIEVLAREIKLADETLEDKRKEFESNKKLAESIERQSAAFITLNNREAVNELVKRESLKCLDNNIKLHRGVAPEPRDIFWDNASLPHKNRVIRKTVVGVFVAALVAFYLLPVSAIIALTDAEHLAQAFPSFKDHSQNIWLVAILESVIPTVLLSVCMLLLQYILFLLTKAERPVCKSDLTHGVMNKYFYFEIFNVLLAFTIGTSLFNFVSEFFQDPANLLYELALNLPSQAPFFCNYMVLSVGIVAMEILQLPRIASQYFFYWFIAYKTPRAKFLLKNQRAAIDYGIWYPIQILMFCIGLTYSAIYPLICFFATIYFGFCTVIFRYQLLYVYVPQYETGGKFYSRFVFPKMIQGFVIQQLTMLGVMLVKQAYAPTGAMIIPTLILTAWLRTSWWRNVTEIVGSDLDEEQAHGLAMVGTGAGGMLSDSDSDSELKPRAKPKKQPSRSPSPVPPSDAKKMEKEGNEFIPDQYDPQTYNHPVFHQPLPQLWLPKKTKECLTALLIKAKELKDGSI